jgi:hypothetical protein
MTWLLHELVQIALWAVVVGVFMFFFDVQITRRRRS